VTPALRRLGVGNALTGAERRVARLAGIGRTNREIAAEFDVSVRTVEHQLQSVYEKLGISGRKDLADALRRDDDSVS
jgi:DNA-binding CsgD family transcriptional regulator